MELSSARWVWVRSMYWPICRHSVPNITVSAKYLETIDGLKRLVKEAGKGLYVFSVGKINPAKLANFEHVDVFVLVACPENSLLDWKTGQFFKPIATPYELHLALRR